MQIGRLVSRGGYLKFIIVMSVLLHTVFSSALWAQNSNLFFPLPEHANYNDDKAALGKLLFLDPILSRDQNYTCLSCHNIYFNGADTRAFSPGYQQKFARLNTPTIYNVSFNQIFSWVGRGKSLTEQTSFPILSNNEMALDPISVEQRVTEKYGAQFAELYGDKQVSFEQVLDVLAEFQKALVTPNARFDQFLRGEISLTEQEAKGYKLFKQYGCASCHNGINIGGNSFQKYGVFKKRKWNPDVVDRFQISGRDKDKYVYRVPSLRNVANTAPYFHHGKAKTLDKAIDVMAQINLGRKIEASERKSIEAFLNTLTGQLPDILVNDK